MTLTIYSPTKTLFSGEVSLCEVPGGKGRFTILQNHDSIISTLTSGNIRYVGATGEGHMHVAGGYVQVAENVITICAKE